MNSHLRLRSVRMRDGGALVRVLHNDVPGIVSRSLKADARTIADQRASDIAGYAIVAWTSDGSTSTQVLWERAIPFIA